MKTVWMSVGMALVMTPAFAQDKQGAWGERMRERRAKMMEMHQKLESEWKAQDAELDKLVADFNSAPAEKKTDALAAVVSKLVELRKSDHEKFANFRKTMSERMHGPSGETGTKLGGGTSPAPVQ